MKRKPNHELTAADVVKGGYNRARNLSPAELSEIGRKGASVRWDKHRREAAKAEKRPSGSEKRLKLAQKIIASRGAR